MGEVKRYSNEIRGGNVDRKEHMIEADNGVFVAYSDYDKLRQQVAELEKKRGSTCVWWTEDDPDFDTTYETGCGQSFILNDGGIKTNGINYCCFCGSKVWEDIADE